MLQPRQLVKLLAFILLGISQSAAVELMLNGFAGDNVTMSDAAVVTSSGLVRLTNTTIENFGHAFYPVAL